MMTRVADGEHQKPVTKKPDPAAGAAADPHNRGAPAARRPAGRGQSRSHSYAQPQNAASMREQVAWEYDNVALRSDIHERNSRRWSTATSCRVSPTWRCS